MIKLNLGCGPVHLEGYTNIDVVESDKPDIVCDITKLPFEDNYADEIRMDAVFEHLWRHQQIPALTEWARVLKPQGKLVINWIPNFRAIAQAYLADAPGIIYPKFNLSEVFRYTHGDYHNYWQYRGLHQVHKDIFDIPSLLSLLSNVPNLKIHTLEEAYYGNEPHPVNINLIAEKN